MKNLRVFLPLLSFFLLQGVASGAPLPALLFLQAGDTTPAPTVTAITPASVGAGGPSLTLTVTGTNFVNGSTVRWNGSPRATTFASATRLTAVIPATDLSTPGTAGVTVALPGGTLSNTVTFTITTETALIFAQIADGVVPGVGTHKATLIALNPNDAAVTVSLEFFQSPGGDPFPIDIGIGPLPAFDVTIPAKSQVVFTSSGGRPATAGWVRMRSQSRIGGLAIFQFFNPTGAFVTEAGVAASPLARHFVVPVEFRDGFESGLALVNPSESASAAVTLRLRQSNQIIGTETRQLGPRQHSALFLRELFPSQVTAGFQGTIEVESNEALAATTLRTLRGLQTSTLPVTIVPGGQ
jgi:hypothetical protein